MPLPEPLKDGRYVLLEPIGQPWGRSEVYLGEDRDLGREVVVKLVRINKKERQDWQEVLAAFKDEARRLASLSHEHIVEIYDWGEVLQEDEALAFIVMRYYKQGSLQDWFIEHIKSSGNLQISEIAALLGQASDILEYVQRRRIVHRDVKPTNFLIKSPQDSSELPTLVLADFGLSLFEGEDTIYDSRGTDYYEAPEQWNKGPLTSATDQYELTVMVYYLLVGRHPFEVDEGLSKDQRRSELKRQHLYVPPPAPSQFRSDVPHKIDEVILRGLVKRPEGRFPDVKTFAEAFRGACESASLQQLEPVPIEDRETIASPPSSAGISPRGPSQLKQSFRIIQNRRLRWIVPIVAVLLLGLLFPFLYNLILPVPAKTQINLAVVIPGGTNELDSIGSATLQGVDLEQKEFNAAHPHGPFLHTSSFFNITDSTNQDAIAQQIIDAKSQGSITSVLIAVPDVSDQLIARLNRAGIPMVSIVPVADTTATTPYLFSVAPSLEDQADTTLNSISDQFGNSIPVKILVAYKNGDAYDKKAASAFWQEAQKQNVNALQPYTYTNLDDLIQYVQSIDGSSALYLASSADDASQLQGMLRHKGISLPILGSADMYQWVYKNHTPEEMENLIGLQFTAFAYHDALAIHDPANSQCVVSGSKPIGDPPYNMPNDYARAFNPGASDFPNKYTHDLPTGETILSYDAVSLVATAAINVGKSLSTQTLWNALHNFTPRHPFIGFSGQISFEPNKSSPYKKAVLLITITRQQDTNGIGDSLTPLAGTSATVWGGCFQFSSDSSSLQ